ncbi:Lipase, GDSL [Corchorus capsularis]|uniref:Lipase, GDSL n=1 Tax=Corchorus capsularis TaxID=210143 RepID=A0A1R3IXT5_COCAP|nr:Lipase, GDSL [Corchorus capsularis]
MNNDLSTLVKCNFPPYGQDFDGGVPTGRFCNGKVPSDLIAEELALKDIVPAYLDPTLTPEDLITGVTFASGGAGFDPLTAKLVSVISLSEQLNYFKEYIWKLTALVGEDRKNFILAKSLFFVVAGSDDIANTYFVLRAPRKLQYDVPAYTDLMELYDLGARRIGIFSAPPIGCVPSQRTLAGGAERECAEEYNQAARLFNKKLNSVSNSLRTSLPDGRFVYIDVYNPLLQLIQDPPKYVLLIGNPEAIDIEVPGNETFPAVIIFGDSIVDTGNNNNNLNTPARCNFPPYGRDFQGGIPTGRFSNGKVPSDFIVEQLGVKEVLPAYLDPSLQPQDLLTGVSFASGGSGYDPLTPTLQSVASLSDQLLQFREYKEKLKAILGEEGTKSILAKSLFVVVAGSNDIANTFFNTRIRQMLHYDIATYTDFIVNSASAFIKQLHELEARKIGVLNAPPIGCMPSSRIMAAGGTAAAKGQECLENYNEAAQLFNSKLYVELDLLNNRLYHAKVVYLDVYTPLLDLVKNHDKYGFEVVDRGCCGTGTVEVSILCNEFDMGTCTNVVRFKGIHKVGKSIEKKRKEKKILFQNMITTVDAEVPNPESPKRQSKFPALIAFGDSILDTGNNNLRLTFTKANFPPYGRDFPGKRATGRFGNGKVFSDLLAGALGIKDTIPAYSDPLLPDSELATGVCFAAAGSGLDRLTSTIQNIRSIWDQVNQFETYIAKLERAVGAEQAKTIISGSIYLVSAGNNDLCIAYLIFLRWFLIGPTFYSSLLVRYTTNFIKEMYALGARKFAIMSTLPLGCLPSDRTMEGLLFLRPCIITTNLLASVFNSKLESEVNKLKTELAGVKIVYVDVYNPLLDIIQNPLKHGFVRASVGCCGTGLVEMGPFCNIFNPFTCWNTSTHVFWDSAHPSEKAYSIVVSQVKDHIAQQLSD